MWLHEHVVRGSPRALEEGGLCKREAELSFPSSVVNSALSRSEEATEEATGQGTGRHRVRAFKVGKQAHALGTLLEVKQAGPAWFG